MGAWHLLSAASLVHLISLSLLWHADMFPTGAVIMPARSFDSPGCSTGHSRQLSETSCGPYSSDCLLIGWSDYTTLRIIVYMWEDEFQKAGIINM